MLTDVMVWPEAVTAWPEPERAQIALCAIRPSDFFGRMARTAVVPVQPTGDDN
jgi:hypothetical protein